MNLRFQVEVDRQPREAEVGFGTVEDAASLARWRFPGGARRNEAILDALEYARLACKRWRYYRRAGATVGSITELREAIRRNPRAEVAMILIVRATWRSRTRVLGFTYFRRSWCHHLVVDFLSAHPPRDCR